jgi:hypothetical protein
MRSTKRSFEMQILKPLCLVLATTGAQAGELGDWMCVFENVPVSIEQPAQAIDDKHLELSVTNGLGFSLSSLAVDLQFSSDKGGQQLERTTVIALNTPLMPGETRVVLGEIDLDAEAVKAISYDDLSARGAIANALDAEGDRLVVREKMGPSYAVHWPKAKKSTHPCN